MMHMHRKWGASVFAGVRTGRITQPSFCDGCKGHEITPGTHSIGAEKTSTLAAMLILAIDTALDACAAAVLDTGANKLIAEESQAMKRGHAEALMPLIARVMKASGVAFAALDRIASDDRSGSFTGLRVGLSAARGIALAAGKPVVSG